MALTKKETKKALNNSIVDGIFASAKNGFSNNYIIPFALALGASTGLIGLVASIPQLIGTLFHPFGAKLIDKYENRKMITALFATLHRLVWIPIALLPIIFGVGQTSIFILLGLLSIMLIFKAVSITSWTSWMIDLVPERIRGRYFGKRNFFSNLSFLIAIVLSGVLLDYFVGINGFIVIFSIGLVLGLISTVILLKIPEIKMTDGHKDFHFSFKHFIRGIREHKNHSNFVMFMVAVDFSRYLIAPFLMVFMLRDLNIGYFWFSIMYAALILSLTVFQIYWGKFSDKYGHRKTVKITYFLWLLMPLALLLVSPTLPSALILILLLFIQLFDGFATSGFNLSAFNYLLETVPKRDSHMFIANYRFITGLAIALALFLGGVLGQYFEGTTLLWISGLQILFFVSFILRIILPLPFLSRFHSIVHTKPVKYKKLFVKAITTYPIKELSHELTMVIQHLHKTEKKSKKSSRR
jgi:MFS family permease